MVILLVLLRFFPQNVPTLTICFDCCAIALYNGPIASGHVIEMRQSIVYTIPPYTRPYVKVNVQRPRSHY